MKQGNSVNEQGMELIGRHVALLIRASTRSLSQEWDVLSSEKGRR